MDYLLTFEDGSEALAHHGIKGMKWGVWNAETRARHQKGPKRPSVAKANLKFAAKMLGVGAAAATAGASLSAAGAALGGPMGAKIGLGAGIGGVLGATANLRERAINKRMSEVEQAKINKGEKSVQKALDQEVPKWKQAGYSSEAEHRAAINQAVKEIEKSGGKVVSTYYDGAKNNKDASSSSGLSEKERASHINQIKASAKALENYGISPIYERAGQDYVNHTKQMASSFRKLAENDPKLKKDIDEFTTMKQRTDDGRKYTNAYKKKACDIGERALGTRPAIDSSFCRTAIFHPTAVTGKTVAIPAWALEKSNSAIDSRHKQAAIRKAFQNPTYRDILEDD